MFLAENALFIIHQFVVGILCMFYLYCAWKDQAAGTFDTLKNVPVKYISAIFLGLCLGLFFMFLREWGIISVLLAFSYAVIITLMIYDPKFAVGFLIFMLLSRPWEYYKDPIMLSMPKDLFLLCFISVFAHKIFHKKYYFILDKTTLFAILFSIWTGISLIPSGHFGEGIGPYLDSFTRSIICFVLIINVVDKKEYILPLTIAHLMGITEKAAMAFYKAVILGQVAEGGRLMSVGMLANSNDIAAIMILAIPYSIGISSKNPNRAIRWFIYSTTLIVYTYLIWQSKSRGATLGIGAFLVTWYWLEAKNKKIASVVVVLGVIASIFLMNFIKRDGGDLSESSANRKIYWQAGINMGTQNPIFGVGYLGFPHYLANYANGNHGSEGAHKTAHSTWILALAETGIVGFFFYMMMWIGALKSAWKVRLKHPEFIMGIISYGVTVTFLSHTYLLYPFILLALSVAAAKTYDRENQNIPTTGLAGSIYKKGL